MSASGNTDMAVSHNEELTEGLQRMLKDSKYSDVTIECEDKTFHCHKVVLAAISPYFGLMFDSGMEETRTGKVCLDFLPGDLCEQVLDFIYTGSDVVTSENVDSLLNVSHLMQIKSLRKLCIEYIRKHLEKGNCVRVWQTVSHYDVPELEAKALSMVKKYFQEICETEDFLELREKKYILKLLTGEHLNCHNEETICSAIFSWISADFKSRSNYLDEILKALINLPISIKLVVDVSEKFQELHNSTVFKHVYDSLTANAVAVLHLDPLMHSRQTCEDVFVVVGGKDFGPNTDVYGFSLSQKLWFKLADLPFDPGYNFAVCSQFMDLFLSGGTNGKKAFYHYSGQTNTWERYPDMDCARYHHSMAKVGNCVYIIGGVKDQRSPPYKEIDIFDLKKHEWKLENHALPTPVRSASCVVHDHMIYILGGFGKANQKSEYRQDFNTKINCSHREEWYKLTEDLRVQARSVVVKDNIYSISKNGKIYLIPRQNKQQTIGKIENDLFPRKGFGVCALENSIMIIGGEVDYQPTKGMLQYCIEDGTVFTMSETLPHPLHDFEFTKMFILRNILSEANALE